MSILCFSVLTIRPKEYFLMEIYEQERAYFQKNKQYFFDLPKSDFTSSNFMKFGETIKLKKTKTGYEAKANGMKAIYAIQENGQLRRIDYRWWIENLYYPDLFLKIFCSFIVQIYIYPLWDFYLFWFAFKKPILFLSWIISRIANFFQIR